MDRFSQPYSSEQAMSLPSGQDVLLDTLGWNGTGPLPTSSLEQGAWSLFMLDHADWQWDQVTSATRDDYRRRYLTIRARVLREERWTLSNAADQLERGFSQLVFGDRCGFEGEIKQIKDCAAACLSDLFTLFMGDNRKAGDRTESWKHVPEDEPDDSELEVISSTKKAVN